MASKTLPRNREHKAFHVDGRLIAGATALLFFAIVVAFPTSDRLIWRVAGVPSITPNFTDARVITSGWECTNKGYDVLTNNPCDPSHAVMNYPRVWLAPAALHLDQSATAAIGVLFAALFLASTLLVMGPLQAGEGLFLAAALVSPPVLLVIERGNNDSLIYGLLAIALLLWRSSNRARWALGCALILVAAIAKLYPILALIVFLRRRTGLAILAGLLIALAFAIYAVLTFHDLILVSRGTPREFVVSYGVNVLPSALDRIWPIWHSLATGSIRLVIYAGAIVTLVASALYLAVYRSKQLMHAPKEDTYADAFVVGGAIYVGTFLLIGSNFDYRLIFIVLTLPFLFQAARRGSWFSRGTLGVILTLLFLSRFQVGTTTSLLFVVDQLLEWGLVVLVLAELWICVEVGTILPAHWRSAPSMVAESD